MAKFFRRVVLAPQLVLRRAVSPPGPAGQSGPSGLGQEWYVHAWTLNEPETPESEIATGGLSIRCAVERTRAVTVVMPAEPPRPARVARTHLLAYGCKS
jgi:hypothetical protein